MSKYSDSLYGNVFGDIALNDSKIIAHNRKDPQSRWLWISTTCIWINGNFRFFGWFSWRISACGGPNFLYICMLHVQENCTQTLNSKKYSRNTVAQKSKPTKYVKSKWMECMCYLWSDGVRSVLIYVSQVEDTVLKECCIRMYVCFQHAKLKFSK